MEVWQLTLEGFMAGATLDDAQPDTGDIFEQMILPIEASGLDLASMDQQQVPDHEEYGFIPTARGDGILMFNGGDEPEPIGAYIGEALAIREDHQRRGLSPELILLCCANRALPPAQRQFTRRGCRALQSAHRLAVQRAIDRGDDVPLEIIDFYERQRSG